MPLFIFMLSKESWFPMSFFFKFLFEWIAESMSEFSIIFEEMLLKLEASGNAEVMLKNSSRLDFHFNKIILKPCLIQLHLLHRRFTLILDKLQSLALLTAKFLPLNCPPMVTMLHVIKYVCILCKQKNMHNSPTEFCRFESMNKENPWWFLFVRGLQHHFVNFSCFQNRMVHCFVHSIALYIYFAVSGIQPRTIYLKHLNLPRKLYTSKFWEFFPKPFRAQYVKAKQKLERTTILLWNVWIISKNKRMLVSSLPYKKGS